MCADLDLFGEVVITYDDVELFLRAVPRHVDGDRFNAVEYYVNNHNVVNKIRCMKLDNSFYSLNDRRPLDRDSLSLNVFAIMKPRFVPLPIIPLSMLKHHSRPKL